MGRSAARKARREAAAAIVRSVAQLVAVLVGGALAGGLVVLAAFPGATGPVPAVATVAGAGLVVVAALLVARRLRPVRPRSRRR